MNTNTKSAWNYIVSQNHILPSPLANKLGVPVLRTLLADILIKLRRLKNCRPKDDYEKKLIEDGIVVIPNFLPDEDFKELKSEFDNNISISENVKIVKKGSMQVNIRKVEKNEYEKFPAMKKFARNKQLIRLISVGEGIKVVDELKKFDLEKTIFGDPDKDTDGNVPFHADIHFHSHKVLYYMSDVTEEGGPFIYCKNSHLNNLDRLWFEFKRGQLKDAHIEGWRIQQHLDKKFFNNYFSKLKNQEYKVACPANTLVIANVHGFHKRGESISGVERSLIRIPHRYNPLGPMGSIPSNLYSGSFF